MTFLLAPAALAAQVLRMNGLATSRHWLGYGLEFAFPDLIAAGSAAQCSRRVSFAPMPNPAYQTCIAWQQHEGYIAKGLAAAPGL